MATDSILGLFTSPQQYQQELQNQALAQGAQLARLSPLEAGRAMGYAGAAQLGRGLAGVMGAEDPMLQMASRRQAIMQQVDQTDPNSLAQAAQALNQAGDVQGARALYQAAQQTQAAKMQGLVQQSQIAKNLRESKTEQQRNYETAVDQGYKGTLQEFILEQRRASAPKTNIGISQKQEEAITKSNVEAFGNLRDEAIAAAKTIESVQAIKPLINQAFTGFAADTKLTAAQIADTFGIPIQGTSETEKLRSIQNNLKIGNSTVLKGAISDKDMAILGQAIGQGNTTAGGIRGIINDLEKNALISQAKYQRANQFQQAGKLSQYDFVEGDKAASGEVNAKLKRLRELESKASQGAK
jgi:hypothetical protein